MSLTVCLQSQVQLLPQRRSGSPLASREDLDAKLIEVLQLRPLLSNINVASVRQRNRL
jgi:hypothetical protein